MVKNLIQGECSCFMTYMLNMKAMTLKHTKVMAKVLILRKKKAKKSMPQSTPVI